jgi:hypothetical protein
MSNVTVQMVCIAFVIGMQGCFELLTINKISDQPAVCSINIFTCTGIRDEMTGSSSDDWIY